MDEQGTHGVVHCHSSASQTNQCPRDCISMCQVQNHVPHCFSGGPVTISKATKRWISGVTMPIQDPRLSGGSVNPLFPGSEMHPLAKMSKDKCIKYMNQQTASVISKATRICLPSSSGCHWIWPGIHPTSIGQSPRELLDLLFNRSSSLC